MFRSLFFLLPILAAIPAHAEPRHDRHNPGRERFAHGQDPRGPALPLLVLGPPMIGAIPGPAPMVEGIFEPPSRFRYFCPQPQGYFPEVAVCDGPWREQGASSD